MVHVPDAVGVRFEQFLDECQKAWWRIKVLVVDVLTRGQPLPAFKQMLMRHRRDDIAAYLAHSAPFLKSRLPVSDMFQAMAAINRILGEVREKQAKAVISWEIPLYADRVRNNRHCVAVMSREADFQKWRCSSDSCRRIHSGLSIDTTSAFPIRPDDLALRDP